MVDLLLRHGAHATEDGSGDVLSLAVNLLLREALAGGLSLPQDLECTGGSSAPATEPAAADSELLRGIRVLSWVEGEMAKLTWGSSCGCLGKGKDFLQSAAGIPPVTSLVWPFGDPIQVCVNKLLAAVTGAAAFAASDK